jgi:hypothetical protein
VVDPSLDVRHRYGSLQAKERQIFCMNLGCQDKHKPSHKDGKTSYRLTRFSMFIFSEKFLVIGTGIGEMHDSASIRPAGYTIRPQVTLGSKGEENKPTTINDESCKIHKLVKNGKNFI